MILMKSTTSPTLTSGAFIQSFGEAQKVNQAVATIDTPGEDGTGVTFVCNTTISGSDVTVTIEKQDLNSAGDWAAAITADVSGMTVTVIADCE